MKIEYCNKRLNTENPDNEIYKFYNQNVSDYINSGAVSNKDWENIKDYLLKDEMDIYIVCEYNDYFFNVCFVNKDDLEEYDIIEWAKGEIEEIITDLVEFGYIKMEMD